MALIFSDLKADVGKLQQKLANQSHSLASALADADQLAVDLDTAAESADRLGAQATDMSNSTQPVDEKMLATQIEQCEVWFSCCY